jgi:hypothetical protein
MPNTELNALADGGRLEGLAQQWEREALARRAQTTAVDDHEHEKDPAGEPELTELERRQQALEQLRLESDEDQSHPWRAT